MEIFAIALQGLQQALGQLDKSAGRIARFPAQAPSDEVSLSDEMVSLLQARQDFEANLRVAKTADELQRQTLDMLA
jgi:flagellar hook protein FlgE